MNGSIIPVIEILTKSDDSELVEYTFAYGEYELGEWQGNVEEVERLLGAYVHGPCVIPLSLPTFSLVFDYAVCFAQNVTQPGFSSEWFLKHLRERMISGCAAVVDRLHRHTPQPLHDFAQALATEHAVAEQIKMTTIREQMRDDTADDVPF